MIFLSALCTKWSLYLHQCTLRDKVKIHSAVIHHWHWPCLGSSPASSSHCFVSWNKQRTQERGPEAFLGWARAVSRFSWRSHWPPSFRPLPQLTCWSSQKGSHLYAPQQSFLHLTDTLWYPSVFRPLPLPTRPPSSCGVTFIPNAGLELYLLL